MIKVLTNEFREGDYAIKESRVTFFGIPIYKNKVTTTNNQIVRQLTTAKHTEKKPIKGFNI